VTIVTVSSVLRTVWGSLWRIHSHGGATYTLFLRVPGATVRVFWEIWRFGLFYAFLQSLSQLKNFFLQKSKCVHHSRTRRHISAKFDVIRPSHARDIVWRKAVTHPPTQTDIHPPSLFRHQWTSLRSTEELSDLILSTKAQRHCLLAVFKDLPSVTYLQGNTQACQCFVHFLRVSLHVCINVVRFYCYAG